MNAITQLDVLDLEATLARYEIGDLLRYWPAVNGIENSNYFVKTADRRDGTTRERVFVLTIMEQPSNAGGAYVPLMDRCVEAGLPVPAIIRNRHGEPFERHDGKLVLLSQRLSGRHVYNPTQRQVAALGRFVARLHQTTAAWDQPVPDYPRTAPWLAHQAALCRGYLPFAATTLLDDAVTAVSGLLAREDAASLPRGVIHGDLFRDNVLFSETGLTGVLDFHHAARGALLYDLAVAANDWCTDVSGRLDEERTLTLLRSYHAIRPLARLELLLFPTFALYAALAFWLSRLSVAVGRQGEEGVRCNNPEEFERIVAGHQARFLYLDERLLTL